MIENQEQLGVALSQLASFKSMLEGMRLHLQDTEPVLIPVVSETYEREIPGDSVGDLRIPVEATSSPSMTCL